MLECCMGIFVEFEKAVLKLQRLTQPVDFLYSSTCLSGLPYQDVRGDNPFRNLINF